MSSTHYLRFKSLALILALTGCAALLDDSDYARLEQPEVAYACAAYLMRVDAPGLAPRVVEVDSKWINTYATGQQWVRSEYAWETNTIYIFPTMHDYARDLGHEMAHAIQYQLGEEFNEWEAKKVGRWIGDCVNFGGV